MKVKIKENCIKLIPQNDDDAVAINNLTYYINEEGKDLVLMSSYNKDNNGPINNLNAKFKPKSEI